jgi:SagB-type dehydrogenase family enzyme
MLPASDDRSLALLYHLNSEPWLNTEAYETEGYEVRYKAVDAVAEPVALPEAADDGGLLGLIRRRSSCRRYAAERMPLNQLAELIAGAYAPTRVIVLPGGVEMDVRAVPSGGGTYPLELYPLLQEVEGLRDGLYHYNILEHSLEPLRIGIDRDIVGRVLLAQPFLENANLVLFIAAVFDRTLPKYGARGYRYVLLEAGHVAQNVCLLATERGLGSLCVGGFLDARANTFLALDSGAEGVVYCVGVGTPAE